MFKDMGKQNLISMEEIKDFMEKFTKKQNKNEKALWFAVGAGVTLFLTIAGIFGWMTWNRRNDFDEEFYDDYDEEFDEDEEIIEQE
jgi:uncharacterized membrane protein